MGSSQCFFFYTQWWEFINQETQIQFFLNVAGSMTINSNGCDCKLYRVLFLKHETPTHSQWVSYSMHAHTDFWERKNCRVRAQRTPWIFSFLFPRQQLKLFPWILCSEQLDSTSRPHFQSSFLVLTYHQGHPLKSMTWT